MCCLVCVLLLLAIVVVGCASLLGVCCMVCVELLVVCALVCALSLFVCVRIVPSRLLSSGVSVCCVSLVDDLSVVCCCVLTGVSGCSSFVVSCAMLVFGDRSF